MAPHRYEAPEPGDRKQRRRPVPAEDTLPADLLQAISLWARGDAAPRPTLQPAIAQALGVKPRVLFPLPDCTEAA